MGASVKDSIDRINLNRILPESEDDLLCIEAVDLVTYDYYKNIYLNRLEQIFAKYDQVRLLFWYPQPQSFPGWESKAAELDFSKFYEYGARIKKVALVNPPQTVSQRWDIRMPLIRGEFCEFENGELEKALAWIKS